MCAVCSWSVIVVLANSQDSLSILLEADQQGLMNGEYVFFLVQHFEVSDSVVSEWQTQLIHADIGPLSLWRGL